jgi:uncharacterized membrane protein
MTRRRNLFVYGLLVVSLAVNLAVAGFFGVMAFRGKPQRTADSTIDFVVGRYPEGVARPLRARLEERRAALAAALSGLQDARRDMRQAMSRDPLDRAALEAALAEARDKAAAFQQVIHSAILDALPEAPAAERAKIEERRFGK